MNMFVRSIGADNRKEARLRLLRFLYEGFPLSLLLQDFGCTEPQMPCPILAGSMVSVVVHYAEHGEILINGVRVVTVNMMDFEADAECLADSTHPAVFCQQMLPLRLGRIAPHLMTSVS